MYSVIILKLVFSMDAIKNAEILKMYREFLLARGEIVFSVVSEPPPTRPDDACVDLCTAFWTPRDASTDGIISLDLFSEDRQRVGSIEIDWKGHKFMESLFRE